MFRNAKQKETLASSTLSGLEVWFNYVRLETFISSNRNTNWLGCICALFPRYSQTENSATRLHLAYLVNNSGHCRGSTVKRQWWLWSNELNGWHLAGVHYFYSIVLVWNKEYYQERHCCFYPSAAGNNCLVVTPPAIGNGHYGFPNRSIRLHSDLAKNLRWALEWDIMVLGSFCAFEHFCTLSS